MENLFRFQIMVENEIPAEYREPDMKMLVSMMWLARVVLKLVIVAMLFSNKVTSYL